MSERRDCEGYRTWERGRTFDDEASCSVSRRGVLIVTAIGALGWLGRRSALAQLAVAGGPREGNAFVMLFLRGGADGLNLVAPYGEDAYYRERPSLAIAPPRDGRTATANRLLDLDGFFGLHPSMGAILPLYEAGTLAVLHAVGSGDRSRSHFEAMAAMERGLYRNPHSLPSGWMARFLEATPARSNSPLRAVAMGATTPDIVRGASHATTIPSLDRYRISSPLKDLSSDAFVEALGRLYANGPDEVGQAGAETLHVLKALNRLDPAAYRPEGGADYPPTDVGQAMRQVAMLLKADVGVETAFVDKDGWDTHVAQGATEGWMTGLSSELALTLRAFVDDLGPARMQRVNVVVMTEFGRRLRENQGLGTDHGRGSFAFVLGGGVRGGRVIADWPGLEPTQLEEPGDLRVTTDYREVLAEVLETRMGLADPSSVFPGVGRARRGLIG
ncbi:MAG: DUF1501 domain-containing protein [Fimbriimonadaceae bacterium]|nr:DUF1501 domain-containing protein [Fimbriimonadaceae bacterium]